MNTIFSKTFDRNGSLEIGLKLLGVDGSRLGFLSRGVTKAVLKDGGTDPEDRELLMMDKMCGPTVGRISLRREVGTVSKGQVEEFMWPMVFWSVWRTGKQWG